MDTALWRHRVRTGLRRCRWQVRTWLGRDLKPAIEYRVDCDPCAGVHGGWAVCPTRLSPQSVVYSCGIGRDISWDTYMAQRYGVAIHAFDPTPESLAWLQSVAHPPGFVVHPYGIADRDASVAFCPPVKAHHVDHSIVDRIATRHQAIEVPMKRLSTVMRELGHDHIDLLKMDIEGAEYGVITDIVRDRLDVRQLLVEFHHRFREIPVAATRDALRLLRQAGYRIFAVSDSGQEYGLLRVAEPALPGDSARDRVPLPSQLAGSPG